MQVSLRSLLVVVALAATCSAQIVPFTPCKPGKASIVGQAEGITFKRLVFVESSGEVGATVLVPDSQQPVPGIVFSHSAIHGPTNSTDLLRFALALARAGAASIVLDGTIEWQVPNDNAKREPHVMACAGQWLLLNEKLDTKHLAIAGAIGNWGGGDTPFCLTGERPCWHAIAWLNFGQTSFYDWSNTDLMLTLRGQLRMARFAQQHLRLAEVKPEWLVSSSRN
jgi:hypothetical protein